ncbi:MULTISPECIES: oligosaccharide flippase family protein [Nocardiaceae]|uniref:Oligosaccharide flippase family protein n=1 Tax=Rhodococcoides kroppenstedtii TaxID=293050 RepID=A0ABS7NW99_9NOCA|nr:MULTISPECIES: oligosaccharide flippase family protein [Rhodococcus]AMY20484.1 hypothetical protein A3Q40_03122 [Rhodococcus sp. PBTS 1]MBY6314322.1 oligosaccharide flippase family protein [Rhodococcus kroppenstedtii]MBY6322221.1 oligosaccharide flippase family protein [Rhodococcus kroppenstedtii]MBY6401030.1 oligosaccharide flippase family protein [Rhodococcus kroppenstedtii]
MVSAQLTQAVLRAAGLATSVLAIAIVSRAVGPEQYATLAVGITLAGILYALSDSGAYQIGVREMAMGVPSNAGASQIVLARAFLLAPFLILAIVVIVVLSDVGTRSVLLITVASAIPYLGVAFRAVSEAFVRPAIVGFVILSQNLVWLAAVAACATLGLDLTWFAASLFFAVCCQALFAYVTASALDRRESPQPSTARGTKLNWFTLVRQSVPLLISGLATTAYYRGHQVVVYALLPAVAAGSYLAAIRVVDAAAAVIPATITSVMLPRLSKKWGSDTDDARSYYKTTLGVTVLIALTIAIAINLLSDSISRVLLGTSFESGSVLRWLCFSLPGMSVGYISMNALIAIGSQSVGARRMFWSSWFGFAICSGAACISAVSVAIALAATEVMIATVLTYTAFAEFDKSRVPEAGWKLKDESHGEMRS